MISVYKIETKAILSKNQGDASLDELMFYLVESDDFLTSKGNGHQRINKLKDLVYQLMINQKVIPTIIKERGAK